MSDGRRRTAPPRLKEFKIRASEDDLKRITELAREKGVSKSELVRTALGLNRDKVPRGPVDMSQREERQKVTKKEPGNASMAELAQRIEKQKGG